MNIILTILSMSLTASVMFAVYLATKRLFGTRLSLSAQYAMLLVILLRLVMPYTLHFSLMNRLPLFLARESTTVTVVQDTTDAPPTAQFDGETAADVQPTTDSAALEPNAYNETDASDSSAHPFAQRSTAVSWVGIVIAVWLTGAFAALGFNIAAYRVYRRSLLLTAAYSEKDTDRLADIADGLWYPDVLIAPHAETPMMLGLFRPVIILPDTDYSDEERTHILRHEFCHYLRFDVVIKWAVVAACAMHWFNPLMPFFRRETEALCELSCDAMATRGMDGHGRRMYIRTLLKTAARQVNTRGVPLTTMSGSAKRLDERFAAVANPRTVTRAGRLLSAASVMAALALAVLLGAYGINRKPRASTVPVSTEDTATDTSFDRYRFSGMDYTIRASDAPADERTAGWMIEPFGLDGTESGHSLNPALMRSVFRLLDWENYTYLGREIDTGSDASEGDYVRVVFDGELVCLLEKDGCLRVSLEALHPEDFLLSDRYPDMFRPVVSDSNDPENPQMPVCVFRVPGGVYDRLFRLLYDHLLENGGNSPAASVSEDDEDRMPDGTYLYGEGDILKIKNGRTYDSADIGDAYLYALLSEKIRIVSADYGCDYTADVGSDAYDVVWQTFMFGSMEDSQEIQPLSAEERAASPTMTIAPSADGTAEITDAVTVYPAHNAVRAVWKGQERWFAIRLDWDNLCRIIAAMQHP